MQRNTSFSYSAQSRVFETRTDFGAQVFGELSGADKSTGLGSCAASLFTSKIAEHPIHAAMKSHVLTSFQLHNTHNIDTKNVIAALLMASGAPPDNNCKSPKDRRGTSETDMEIPTQINMAVNVHKPDSDETREPTVPRSLVP